MQVVEEKKEFTKVQEHNTQKKQLEYIIGERNKEQ